MRLMTLAAFLCSCSLIAVPMMAISATTSDPAPEIQRDIAKPQAAQVPHTLRQIPEACTRLEGMFTAESAEPYRLTAVRSSPNCRPRARYIEAVDVKPTTASGWVLNDLIRVPSASCPSQQAVVRVWRQSVNTAPPQRDGQGQLRIYLEQTRQQALAGKLAPLPLYTAELRIEGQVCG